MSYCTLEDIKKAIPEENLIQLTDDDNLGVVNEDTVDDAVDYADQLIDGYLRGRYTLPLTSVPKLVTKLSLDLAVFYLYSRRLELEMPKGMESRYKNAVRILGEIQKGNLSLSADEATEPTDGTYQTNKTSEDRVFSGTVLDTY
jgi:phage gp36-like protein